MWCFDLGYPNNGFCFPSKDCSSNPDVCAAYRATCTETKHGSFCLNAKYELGSAAPDASTAGAGGAGGSSSGTGGVGGGG